MREAQKAAPTDPKKAEQIYKDIISKPPSVTSEAAIREYETALIALGELYRDQKSVWELRSSWFVMTCADVGTTETLTTWSSL